MSRRAAAELAAAVLGAGLTIVALGANTASAMWTNTVQPVAITGTVQILGAPVLSAPSSGTQKNGSIIVSWTQAKTTDNSVATGYLVVRNIVTNGSVSSTTTAAGACTGTVTSLTCADTVPVDGSYSYTVTAIYQSWTRPSASNSGTVLVDTVRPLVVLTAPASPTNVNKPPLGGTAGKQTADSTHSADGATVAVALTGGPTSGAGGSAAVNTATGAWSFTPSIALTDGTYTITITQRDAAGNAAPPATGTVQVDTVPTVTINQAVGQADPVTSINTTAINFTVVFNRSVTGLTASDVTFSGTSGGTKAVAVTGSGATYNVAVTGMTTGTVIPSVPAGAATDSAGNPSVASTSTDQTVSYTQTATALGATYSDGNPGQGDFITGTATPGATITIAESTPTAQTFSGPADATGAFNIEVENLKPKKNSTVTYSYSVTAQAPGFAATTMTVSGSDSN